MTDPLPRTVVVAGLAKTGTTALFFKIKQVMPADALALFEPRIVDLSAEQAGHVVAKVLIGVNRPVDEAALQRFDRKILLTRDPRDMIVSRLLYDVYNESVVWADDAHVAAFVGLLRRKEADPASVSLSELIDLYDRKARRAVWPRATGDAGVALDFQARHPDYRLYRYEDLVRADFRVVESYLGWPLGAGAASVPAEFSRVARTRSQGDWRNWFTPRDVEIFSPYVEPYLAANGYPIDWRLSDRPVIAPAHGSAYVERLVRERRLAVSS